MVSSQVLYSSLLQQGAFGTPAPQTELLVFIIQKTMSKHLLCITSGIKGPCFLPRRKLPEGLGMEGTSGGHLLQPPAEAGPPRAVRPLDAADKSLAPSSLHPPFGDV